MRGFRLGSVMGIDVHLHASWFIIAILVMWSLAAAALPADFPALDAGARLLMAAAITLLFFVSLLAHELAHSIVAVTRGIPVHRITFFLFGGMAQTSRDSRSPGEEFLIAIAGPVCSFLLGGFFLGLWWGGAGAGWPGAVVGVAAYTGILNLILAVFNMLPGYPMDGGRVLRAAIWKVTGSVTRATRWASRVGEWMAYGLMVFGVWDMARGNVMGGIWLILIALFIRNVARAGYRQHVLGKAQEVAREWQERGQHHAWPAGEWGPRGRPAPTAARTHPAESTNGGRTAAPGALTGRDVTHLTREAGGPDRSGRGRTG